MQFARTIGAVHGYFAKVVGSQYGARSSHISVTRECVTGSVRTPPKLGVMFALSPVPEPVVERQSVQLLRQALVARPFERMEIRLADVEFLGPPPGASCLQFVACG
jgi:hypothetical protein